MIAWLRTLVVLASLVLSGCAGARATTSLQRASDPSAALAPVRVLLAQGCYDCLRDALDVAEPLAGRTPASTVLAFEAALLLSVREKELGLPATPYAEKARRLAEQLAPTFSASTYLAIADAMPWDAESRRKDFGIDFRRMHRITPTVVQEWVQFLHAAPADPAVNDYLALAIGCQYDFTTCQAEIERVATSSPVPLLSYRIGIAGLTRQRDLESAITAEPRFVEARLFLGRYGLARTTSTSVQVAGKELEAAYARFDQSPTAALALAAVVRALRDWSTALRLYDRALSLVPNQEDALLGRTVALTQLQRPEEAATAATTLLDVGPWYGGEARYWRAWNRLRLGQLDEANEDAQAATRLMGNTDVFTLAGIIELQRKQASDARRDLERARGLDASNCSAQWYLGLAHMELGATAPAAATFAGAFECFTAATARLKTRLAETEAEDLPPDQKVRQLAEYQQELEESVRQEGNSAFNAALAYAQSGDRAAARQHAEVAQQYDGVKDRAAELLRDLDSRTR